MRKGFLYLVAIMDWFSRRVLAWRLSNTMEADFCIEALEEAMARFGKPFIFNTDQGSQFTSPRFTEVLTATEVKISMDGRGRWMDNVFIERLRRSLKYECVCTSTPSRPDRKPAPGSESGWTITTAQGHTRPWAEKRRSRPTWPATASAWRRDGVKNQA